MLAGTATPRSCPCLADLTGNWGSRVDLWGAWGPHLSSTPQEGLAGADRLWLWPGTGTPEPAGQGPQPRGAGPEGTPLPAPTALLVLASEGTLTWAPALAALATDQSAGSPNLSLSPGIPRRGPRGRSWGHGRGTSLLGADGLFLHHPMLTRHLAWGPDLVKGSDLAAGSQFPTLGRRPSFRAGKARPVQQSAHRPSLPVLGA